MSARPAIYSREEMEAFCKFLKEQEIKFRGMVHIDINSLDPLERQGDDSRDLQFDVEREREQDGDVRYYGNGE
jgi:hypothetical protein